jgi:hypothetical protein
MVATSTRNALRIARNRQPPTPATAHRHRGNPYLKLPRLQPSKERKLQTASVARNEIGIFFSRNTNPAIFFAATVD